MQNKSLLLGYTFLALLCVSVFKVKYAVQSARQELRQEAREIYEISEDIHLLEGEWAVLTHPNRLQKLAKTYLKMDAVDGSRVTVVHLRVPEKNNLMHEKEEFQLSLPMIEFSDAAPHRSSRSGFHIVRALSSLLLGARS